MLSRPNDSVHHSCNCSVTYGVLGDADEANVSKRNLPWSIIDGQQFISKVDLILPSQFFDNMQDKVFRDRQQPQWYKFTMGLHQLLQSDFLVEMIRKRNVTMLAQGQSSLDTSFSVSNGTLTMHLDKATYERIGISGRRLDHKPSAYWEIKIDLTDACISPDTERHDRLLKACQTVLSDPRTWDVYNGSVYNFPTDIVSRYRPVERLSAGQAIKSTVSAPGFLEASYWIPDDSSRADFEQNAMISYEWLSLIRLESPRVSSNDAVDMYLSRYEAIGDRADQVEICKVSWKGFIARDWFRALVRDVLAASPSECWVSVSAVGSHYSQAGDKTEVSVLKPVGTQTEYLAWEIKKSL